MSVALVIRKAFVLGNSACMTRYLGVFPKCMFTCMIPILILLIINTTFAADKPEIFVQTGHSKSIYSVAFSRDGRYAISAGGDRTIIWEVSTGKEIRSWNSASSLAVSQDGEKVLLGAGYEMKLYDLSNGREINNYKGHSSPIESVALSPDGRYALSGSGVFMNSTDNTVRLWETSTGKEIRTFHGHSKQVHSVAFSPDGRHILSGSYDNTIKIWDIATGREIRSITVGEFNFPKCVAFSPDGRFVLSGTYSREIIVFDASTGQKIKSVTGHSTAVNAVTYSADGRYVLSGGYPGEVKLWDISAGKEIRTFKGHVGEVTSVVFSPDGRQVLSGGVDTTLRLWDVSTGKEIRTFASDTLYISSVAYSPEGTHVLSSFGNNLHLWDMSSGNRIKVFTGHKDKINQAIYSPDGRYALSGGGAYNGIADNDLRLWDVKTGREIRSFSGHSNSITSVAFSPNGQYVLSGSADKTLKLWETSTGQERRTFQEPVAGIYSFVSFSRDGSIAMATKGDSTDVWKPKTFLNLYEISTGRRMSSLEIGSIVSVGYSADKRYAVTGRLQLLDVLSAKIIRTYSNSKHGHSAMPIIFSTDARYFMTVVGTKLTLWDIPSGNEVRTFAGDSGDFSDAAFSSDGRYVIAGGGNGNVVVWNFSTGKEIAQFISFTDGEWIVISPEGYYNASPNGDKHLNVRVGNTIYGIENYREAFFRPDLVKVALSGGSLQDFRKLADVKQPPAVSIVDTPTSVNTDKVTVKLRLTDNGGGIGDIRLYLNGTAVVMDSRAVKIIEKETKALAKEYTLMLASGRNLIKAVAFNGDNTMQSNEAPLEVVASFAAAGKPSLSALVIGINEFTNPKLKLNYPVADAELFAETIQEVSAGLFDKVNIRKLTSKEATTNLAIIREIKSFQSLRPDDLFVFYIASHGTVDEGEYFLITSNVGSLRTEKLKTDAISQNMLKEVIANIPATKKLIIIDTCNAGALGEAIQVAMLTRGMSEDTALKILSRAVGSTILSASTSVQEALEGYNGHGLFTHVLSEGLKGKADKGKTGYIKTTDLADYVDNEVPVLAEKVFKRSQYPTISISGQAFPIGKVR